MGADDGTAAGARIFRNATLERLTLFSASSFMTMWGVLLPCIAWIGWGTASLFKGGVLVICGAVFWTVFEYGMYRHLFHLTWRRAARFVHIFHGNHHDVPNDPLRNLMPPVVSLPIAGAVWAICIAWLGEDGTWFFLGFISGYVVYDLLHYACHQWPMRGRLAMVFKRHHMRHHHSGIDGNYGVTGIFWDRVFRTRINRLRKASPPEG